MLESKKRVLFILKYRQKEPKEPENSSEKYGYLNSGVWQSAKFLCDELNEKNIAEAKCVHAIDNDFIDKLVTDYKADIVIIEAFWVVPEKFEILTQLHPNVKWIIRNHSAMPFIASEGIIIDWSLRYVDYKNVYIACNEYRTYEQFRFLVNDKQKTDKKVLYLPNTYPTKNFKKRIYNKDNFFHEEGIVNIGCFGSVRPLKNHLMQAQAAIQFSKSMGRYLKFHINSAHIEDGGNSALHNLIDLFNHTENCELVCHDWLEHNEFLDLCSKMDIGLQVSFTETFNIVAADLTSQDVPVIGSNEISWLYDDYKTNPNDSLDITRKMIKAVSLRKSYFNFNENTHKKLKHFCNEAIKQWNKVISLI